MKSQLKSRQQSYKMYCTYCFGGFCLLEIEDNLYQGEGSLEYEVYFLDDEGRKTVVDSFSVSSERHVRNDPNEIFSGSTMLETDSQGEREETKK